MSILVSIERLGKSAQILLNLILAGSSGHIFFLDRTYIAIVNFVLIVFE